MFCGGGSVFTFEGTIGVYIAICMWQCGAVGGVFCDSNAIMIRKTPPVSELHNL
jgi:hypothetical protein